MNNQQPEWMRQLGRLLPLAAVVAVYFRSCGYEFINYDDNIHVYANPLLAELTPKTFFRLWTEPYEGLYVPLTYTLWALLTKLSALLPLAGQQFNPHLFHTANVLVHGLNTLLVAALLRRLLRHEGAAIAGALLFALHPVQVEAVAWVTCMRDLLCGLFSLLALWNFVLFAQGDTTGQRARRYAFALICYGLALLAKPGAVVVPLLAAVLGLLLPGLKPRQLAVALAPWLVMAVPVVLITKFSQPETIAIFIPPWWQRLLVAGDAVTFYTAKLLFPWTLAPDYGRTPEWVVGQGWHYLTGVLPWLSLAGAIGLCRRSPGVLAGVGLFVVAILPVSGILPFSYQAMSTVADRYLYLALLGPAYLLGRLLVRFQQRRLIGWGVAALLSLCAVRTLVQLPPWRDSLAFNTFALQENPRSWTAATNLGVVLQGRKRLPEAVALYEQAVRLNPGYVTAYYNLGVVRAMLNQGQQAAAAYQQAIKSGPSFFLSYNNLCNLYLTMGRADLALAVLQQAVGVFVDPGLDPDLARITANPGQPLVAADDGARALLYNLAGRFQLEMNQPAEAIRYLVRAKELDPGLAEAFNNLGSAYAAQGQGEQAIAAYTRTSQLLPAAAEPFNNLCLLYNSLARGEEAVAACKQAIARNEGFAEAYFNLGNAYRLLAREEEALASYKQTLALEPSHLWAAFYAAEVCEALHHPVEAIALYRHALAIKPDFAEANRNLSRLLLQSGEHGETAP